MKTKIVLVVLFFAAPLYGVTFVYNMRVAATTRRQAASQPEAGAQQNKNRSLFAAVLINQWGATKNGIKRYSVGPVGFYIRTFKSGYFSISGAGGYITQNMSVARTKRKRAQFDDILCMAGRRFSLSEQVNVTVSGLLGIPTHKDTVFEGVEFGTGHVGVGGQLDGAWLFDQEKNRALMGAVRYFYLIQRDVQIPVNKVSSRFSFHPGNFMDLLFAYQIGAKPNSFEIGYNPSFAFGAKLEPTLVLANVGTTVIRSSFYANYKRVFLLGNHPSGVGIGFSYAFDHVPKNIGFKRIVTLWGAWGINF